MNIHAPSNPESETELRYLSCSKYNMISAQSSKPGIAIVQDSLLGAFLMTRGYDNIPISNFYQICSKGKNFTKTKVDSIEELTAEVMDAISKKNEISFVDAPKKPKLTTKTKLAEEALAFVKYGEDVEKVSQINEFLSEFEILKDFEDHGLFFDEGVVKLNKVYTLKEVVDAVTETIDIIK